MINSKLALPMAIGLLAMTSGWAEEVNEIPITTFIRRAKESQPPEIPTAKMAGNDPSDGAPAKPVEWVAIPGGKFIMGTKDSGFDNAKPVREVTIETFDMSKTAVTVEQYAECVDKGRCTKPDPGDYCNWGEVGRESHPVNCVNWFQARAYAKFMDARLPSESEWEYAATSGGKKQKYPWGNKEPNRELVVFNDYDTMPVCSKPKGNTAQGLCDMSGNVWQWVQDKYGSSYTGVATDGSAFEGVVSGSDRVMRGGCYKDEDSRYLHVSYRNYNMRSYNNNNIGFRLARFSR